MPPKKKALVTKWVYTVTFKSDKSIEYYKARLIVLGNHQIEGENFEETFSPVVKMDTIRLFLGVAAKRGWFVHQMDVHNAFLNDDLKEEVYIKLSQGFHSNDNTKVC